jgi:WD40 repeat protein
VLSQRDDNTIKVWDAATGALLCNIEALVASRRPWPVALSVDGARVLSGSDDDTFKLWDPATGKQLHTFKGHSGALASVAFSPCRRSCWLPKPARSS